MTKYSGQFGDPVLLRAREKAREERLERAGYPVVEIVWDELLRHPRRVYDRHLRAFARAAGRAA